MMEPGADFPTSNPQPPSPLPLLSHHQYVSGRAGGVAARSGANEQRDGAGCEIGRNGYVDLLHARNAGSGAGVGGDEALPVGDLDGYGGAIRNAGGPDADVTSGSGSGTGCVHAIVLVQHAIREYSRPRWSQDDGLRR